MNEVSRLLFFLKFRLPPRSPRTYTLFPDTTRFRSASRGGGMIALVVCRSRVTRSRRQFFQLGEEKALTPQIKRPDFGRPQETPHVVSGGLPVDLRNRADRKSVVWGTSVSVRVDLGGRRIIKKKKHTRERAHMQ